MSVKVLEQARMSVTTTEVGQRTLDFYAATFSTEPDKNGDIIDPHALDAWLKAFYAEGKPLPISFAHAAIRDETNPFQVIGRAPADPDHVWIDDYGLRVKGLLDMSNDTAKQVALLIDNGVVGGASIAFMAEREKRLPDGSARITQMSVMEAGPCLNPANTSAVVLGLKTAEMKQLVEELRASVQEIEVSTVDTSGWDGNKAMTACNGAADYGAICAAEHTTGVPDERQHWAFPHHFLATAGRAKGPNEGGVTAGLQNVKKAQNITDAERASGLAHLQDHMKEINPDYEPPKTQGSEAKVTMSENAITVTSSDGDVLVPELKHGTAPTHIQHAHDALVRAGAKCAASEAATKNDSDDVQAWLRRMRHIKLSVT